MYFDLYTVAIMYFRMIKAFYAYNFLIIVRTIIRKLSFSTIQVCLTCNAIYLGVDKSKLILVEV